MAKIADQIEAAPESYTTESTPSAEPTTPRPVLNVSGAAVGRRKQAIARVRIAPGAGGITVNGREFADYFPNKLHQQLITDPFTVLELSGSYDVIARITGGGPSGQAGALRLAIARALNEIDRENNRATLKKAGLKKARKAPQFSKR
jgi:small subunit ribosomal protein S9